MAEKLDKKNDSLFPFQTYTFRNTTELETMCPSAFDIMLNPEHEHELWIGNINGLVSPTSEYGLAIKLKGYIIAGKKLTFILPENYEAIRPDTGNIGFRKTVLDMIRLGESRKQITIFTYSIEHAEDDINKILKEYKETDMKFDVIIANPPYFEPVPEGKTRTSAHLDSKIWKSLLNISENIIAIMSSSCNQMQNMKYTYITEKFSYPGDANIDVCIFEHLKGQSEVEIIKKSVLNGKQEWLVKNDKSSTNYTLWHAIDRKTYGTFDVIPQGYIGLSEVSTKNFTIFLPNESILYKSGKKQGQRQKMVALVKTNKPNDFKNWLLTEINPLHNKFKQTYDDIHIDRGFSKCIIIPDNLK